MDLRAALVGGKKKSCERRGRQREVRTAARRTGSKGRARNRGQLAALCIDAKRADGAILVVPCVQEALPAAFSRRNFSGIDVVSAAAAACRERRAGKQRQTAVRIHPEC